MKCLTEEDQLHRFDYIIGIDPGTETGWAVWDVRENRIESVASMPIHEVLDRISNIRHSSTFTAMYRIEDPTSWRPFRNTPRNAARLQGAGSIKRDYAILTDAMRDWGIPFEAVPLQAAQKKLTAEQFRKVTGWTGRTNQHGRDAAMLCWKTNPKTK